MDQEKLESALTQMASLDPWYQQLLRECGEAEKDYLRIRDSLPEEDREKLDRYITLCEELGYRLTTLALEKE